MGQLKLQNVDLPPVIAVRRLLRSQQQRRDAYRSWVNLTSRSESGRGARSRRERITGIAQSYLQEFERAGVLHARVFGSLERLKLKSERGLRLQGYVLWPVTFGRQANTSEPAFTEHALMLVQTGGQFSSSKASVYEAPVFFGWTRHALERLCERDSLGADLAVVLGTSTLGIIKALSLARAFNLIKADAHGGLMSETAWVPFRGGLLVLTARVAAADRSVRELGWKFSFTKGHFSTTLIKQSNIVPAMIRDGSGGAYRDRSLICTQSWFVSTYVANRQLSVEQLRYANLFDELQDQVHERAKSQMFSLYYDPMFNKEGIDIDDSLVPEQARSIAAKLSMCIDTRAFEAQERHSITHILSSDMSSSEYRKSIGQTLARVSLEGSP